MALVLETQLNGSSHFEAVYLLDEFQYGFRFYTNGSNQSWYFDIFDPYSNTNTLVGLKVVAGLNLLYKYQKSFPQNKVPTGYLIVADLNTLTYTPGEGFSGIIGNDPPTDGFENDLYQLVYVSLDEVN